MRKLIALILILATLACSSKAVNQPIPKNAPAECFENGVFNENIGTDTLDCGNLE